VMNSLALQIQEALHHDPHAGDLYVFRGKRGDLLKILWHDGLGMSLYAKRLERGRVIWPSPRDGVMPITAAQLGGRTGGGSGERVAASCRQFRRPPGMRPCLVTVTMPA